MKPNRAVTGNIPGEFQSYPKRFELNRYSGETITGLDNGKRKLATSKECSFLAIDGHQIRLRQNLQDALLLQCLNYRAKRSEERRVGKEQRPCWSAADATNESK